VLVDIDMSRPWEYLDTHWEPGGAFDLLSRSAAGSGA
jgi:hypothetical protein